MFKYIFSMNCTYSKYFKSIHSNYITCKLLGPKKNHNQKHNNHTQLLSIITKVSLAQRFILLFPDRCFVWTSPKEPKEWSMCKQERD
jgi:hypothetical protein